MIMIMIIVIVIVIISTSSALTPCRIPPQTKNEAMFAPIPAVHSPRTSPSVRTICIPYARMPPPAAGWPAPPPP
jgi:hypothetical protein